MTTTSETLFARARGVIAGGVNSPVRAFKGVGGTPIFFKRAKGAYVFDADDKAYIDYVGSWGPMIAGHNHPDILAAVEAAAGDGLSFGAPCEREIILAEKICERVPSIEKVRMVNSGTEATMSAIRLARGFTGRNKIIKFTGCYHGHSDGLLVKAGSGVLTLGIPGSPGVPEGIAQYTLSLPYNDLAAVTEAFAAMGDDIAGIIVEPVAGNMNCVLPQAEFLSGLRKLCDEYGSLLIFDEVMTGFRVALGGAQAVYNVTPDITTLGKVIGGGMPVGAFGGRADVMNALAPDGPVYQAGTLSGNPVAMAAGLATLELISQAGFYDKLSAMTQTLTAGLQQVAREANIPLLTTQLGGMFGFFFTEQEKVTNYDEVAACDIERFKTVYHSLLTQGIYFGPSAFEAAFVSSTHTQSEIDKTLAAFATTFSTLNKDSHETV